MPREDHVVVHLVARQVPARHHRGARRRARRGVRLVVGRARRPRPAGAPATAGAPMAAATSARAPGRRRRTARWDDDQPCRSLTRRQVTADAPGYKPGEDLGDPHPPGAVTGHAHAHVGVAGVHEVGVVPARADERVVDREERVRRRARVADVLAERLPVEAARRPPSGSSARGGPCSPSAGPSPRPSR